MGQIIALTKQTNGSLNEEVFAKWMVVLGKHFPCLRAEKERMTTMYEFLKDLSNVEFENGVREFCKRQKEIYPNTNIVAYIREFGKPHVNWEDEKWRPQNV